MRFTPLASLLLAGSLITPLGLAQSQYGNDQRTTLPETVGQPVQGPAPIIETVDQIMQREYRSPVVDLTKPRSIIVDAKREAKIAAVNPPIDESRWAIDHPSPRVPFWPFDPSVPAVHDQPSAFRIGGNSFDPAAIGINFLATSRANASPGYVPPDTHGSVGPTQIIVHVNGSIRLFSKTGVLGALNASSDVFFNSVRAGGSAVDPRTYYDPISQRWFVSAITTTSPNRVLLAVSNGPTITGTSSFAFYGWVQDTIGTPGADAGALFDYPSLGVDRHAIYIGGNVFGGGTPSVFVINKASALSGGPLTITAFRQLGAMNAPMGCSNTSLTSNFGYFIGSGGNGVLTIRRISNPGGTPTISAAISLTVPSTAVPLTVPQAGGGSNLSGVDQRLIGGQILRNQFSTTAANDRTLWCSHNIQVNSSGVGGAGGTRNGIRWYQIGNLDVTPTLVQSGTVFDTAASNPRYYWMGMVAMNGQGHAAVAGSVSSTLTFPNVAVAGRLRTDTLGTIGAPQVATAAPGTYNAGGGTQRWGDYAAVALDPADEQTLWGFAELSRGGDQWGVQVVQLTAPAPSTPTSVSPTSANRGTSLSVQINGTPSAGSEYFNTEDANANKLNASFSGLGITVNSVTWGGPLQANRATANITISPAAPVGARFVTVTNPDGQAASSGTALFTVTAGCAADFNSDTVVDFFDYLDFVAAFSSNNASADFNADTTIDFFDYLDFVAAFSNGC
ncbi:MAG: hypothetical protein KGS45_00165 [Planctomycetes bacterium]|nr:hypothetical protein [Planctomycetota bacterium]